jgi:uncharacterized protein DUF3108
MKQKNIHRIVSALLIILCLSACAAPSQPSPTETQVIDTQAPPATSTEQATEPPATPAATSTPAAVAGLCTNTYYPVREGSTWTYKSTGSPAGAYSFTDTITAVRPDGFTLTSQFEKLTRTQEWACKPEGLVALQLGGAAVSTQNMNLTVQTQNVSGVSYPKEIKVGDQWDYSLDFTGKLEVAGNSGQAKGKDKNHFNALGMESVTVPAGTFDALKIQIDTTLDITASIQGVTVPVQFSGSYTYWFVKDVGWVKASGTGSVSGTSFSETIELQAYNIP